MRRLNHIRIVFEKHLNSNLSLYTKEKLTKSNRLVLIIKWVANGLSIKFDRSKKDVINICGRDNCKPISLRKQI